MTTKYSTNDLEKIQQGLNKAANIVTSTMGGQGKTVVLASNDKKEQLRFTKDGVTVAESINFPDELENVGAQILISAAQKTVDTCGDGPQPLWAKIMTPDGFIKMGDIQPGDTICGTNETTQTVLEVFDKGEKEIYEIHFTDKRVVECSKDHLWTIINNDGKQETLPVSKLIERKELLVDKINGKNPEGLYVPRTTTHFDTSELPIEPYLLGLLLGDGSLSGSGDIELSLGLSKEYIIDYIPSQFIKSVNYNSKKNYFRIKLCRLEDSLKKLGLYGTTSSTKFIPKQYLFNSLENRKALLAGLLDTDGHINKRGRFEYNTVSKHLKDDFQQLVWSMGININTRLHLRKNDADSFSNVPIFRIVELSGYKYGNKISKIVATGRSVPMRCIKVSNPDSLYLTDNFIVTHNTTLTSLLLQSLIRETKIALKKNKDVNKVLKDIEYSVGEVINFINKNSKKVKDSKDIFNIASTSANSYKVGNLFKEIYDQTGLDALITLQKSEDSIKTHYEVTKGIQFNNGYVHPSFMTNKDTEQAIYEDAYIHVDSNPISTLTEQYQELLSLSVKQEIPVIIIAPRFSDAFIRTCSMNKVNQGAKVCLIKTPGYGANIKRNEEDMKAFISKDNYVDKIIVTDRTFTLYNQEHNNLEDRLKRLKSLEENAQDELDRQNYLSRYYKLKSATAIIYAGGATRQSMEEEYDRLEDAIGATRTAVEYGYIEGGGVAFLRAVNGLKLHPAVKKTILTPFSKILSNANVTKADIDFSNIMGYNVKTHTYEDFFKSGIIDPSNVLIVALLNAFTNTKLLINTSYVLYNEYNSMIK